MTTTDDDFGVLEFIDLVDRLTAVLNDETERLENGEPHMIDSLQDEKRRLSAAVRQGMVAVQTDQHVFDDGSIYYEEDMAELREAVAVLNTAAHRNEAALRAAIRSTDRLIKAVVRAMGEQKGELDARYTALGLRGVHRAGAAGALNELG
jgi:flagellar biosynthesis/type III secretory pathway chaperone